MTEAQARYGRVKFSTIYAAKDDLRRLIQNEGTPAIQAAWDRLEQWIDSPPMTLANHEAKDKPAGETEGAG